MKAAAEHKEKAAEAEQKAIQHKEEAHKALDRIQDRESRTEREFNRLLDWQQIALQAEQDAHDLQDQAKQAKEKAEAEQAESVAYQAWHIEEVEKDKTLFQVANNNSEYEPLHIQWAMQAQKEYVLRAIWPQPHARADALTGVPSCPFLLYKRLC